MTRAVKVADEQPAVPAVAQALTPLQMLNVAIERGADIGVLEKLMDLHARWETSQARKAFDAAIAAAKSELPTLVKNRTVEFEGRAGGKTSYKFTDMAEIARVVNPILASHGLSYRYRTAQDGPNVQVTCVLSHKDGHAEETTLQAGNDTSGSKNAIQAVGSTVTFLQRYTLTAALGLASGEDDDGRSGGVGAKVITDEQIAELKALIKSVSADEAKLLAFLKIDDLSDIRADKFDTVKAIINRKRAREA